MPDSESVAQNQLKNDIVVSASEKKFDFVGQCNYGGELQWKYDILKDLWQKRIFRQVIYGLYLKIDVWPFIPCFRKRSGTPYIAKVEKAHFLKFYVTFLEILTCRTKTDVGFGSESVAQNYQEMAYLGQLTNNKFNFVGL